MTHVTEEELLLWVSTMQFGFQEAVVNETLAQTVANEHDAFAFQRCERQCHSRRLPLKERRLIVSRSRWLLRRLALAVGRNQKG